MVLRSAMILALLAFASDTSVADAIKARDLKKSTTAIKKHKAGKTASAKKASAEKVAAEKAAIDKAATEKASWGPHDVVSQPHHQAAWQPLSPHMPSGPVVSSGPVASSGLWSYTSPLSGGATGQGTKMEIPLEETTLTYAQSALNSCLEAIEHVAVAVQHVAAGPQEPFAIPVGKPVDNEETKESIGHNGSDGLFGRQWTDLQAKDKMLRVRKEIVAKALTAVSDTRQKFADAQEALSLAIPEDIKNNKQVAKVSGTLAAAKSQASSAFSRAKAAVPFEVEGAKKAVESTHNFLEHAVEGTKETVKKLKVKKLKEDIEGTVSTGIGKLGETMKRLQVAQNWQTLLEKASGKVSEAGIKFRKMRRGGMEKYGEFVDFLEEKFVEEPVEDKVLSRWAGMKKDIGEFFTTQDTSDPWDRL